MRIRHAGDGAAGGGAAPRRVGSGRLRLRVLAVHRPASAAAVSGGEYEGGPQLDVASPFGSGARSSGISYCPIRQRAEPRPGSVCILDDCSVLGEQLPVQHVWLTLGVKTLFKGHPELVLHAAGSRVVLTGVGDNAVQSE